MSMLPGYRKSLFFSQRREDGLKLRAFYAGDHVYTDFEIDERFQSETISLCNGILFGIVDVLMWYAVMMQAKKICMTRRVNVDFFEPLLCRIPYRAKSRLLDADGKDYYVDAWIEDGGGKICTKVSALFKEGKNINLQEIIGSFDFSEATPEMQEYFHSFIK
jgi:acyl-coenzyme A thioesterase PaaI-like protein